MKRATITKCAVLIVAGIAVAPCAADTKDIDTWQTRTLFEPSDLQLKAETRGHVVIYEGLEEATVKRALDTQFSRIDNMMFVGTVRNDPQGNVMTDPETGRVVTEDDGC